MVGNKKNYDEKDQSKESNKTSKDLPLQNSDLSQHQKFSAKYPTSRSSEDNLSFDRNIYAQNAKLLQDMRSRVQQLEAYNDELPVFPEISPLYSSKRNQSTCRSRPNSIVNALNVSQNPLVPYSTKEHLKKDILSIRRLKNGGLEIIHSLTNPVTLEISHDYQRLTCIYPLPDGSVDTHSYEVPYVKAIVDSETVNPTSNENSHQLLTPTQIKTNAFLSSQTNNADGLDLCYPITSQNPKYRVKPLTAPRSYEYGTSDLVPHSKDSLRFSKPKSFDSGASKNTESPFHHSSPSVAVLEKEKSIEAVAENSENRRIVFVEEESPMFPIKYSKGVEAIEFASHNKSVCEVTSLKSDSSKDNNIPSIFETEKSKDNSDYESNKVKVDSKNVETASDLKASNPLSSISAACLNQTDFSETKSHDTGQLFSVALQPILSSKDAETNNFRSCTNSFGETFDSDSSKSNCSQGSPDAFILETAKPMSDLKILNNSIVVEENSDFVETVLENESIDMNVFCTTHDTNLNQDFKLSSFGSISNTLLEKENFESSAQNGQFEACLQNNPKPNKLKMGLEPKVTPNKRTNFTKKRDESSIKPKRKLAYFTQEHKTLKSALEQKYMDFDEKSNDHYEKLLNAGNESFTVTETPAEIEEVSYSLFTEENNFFSAQEHEALIMDSELQNMNCRKRSNDYEHSLLNADNTSSAVAPTEKEEVSNKLPTQEIKTFNAQEIKTSIMKSQPSKLVQKNINIHKNIDNQNFQDYKTLVMQSELIKSEQNTTIHKKGNDQKETLLKVHNASSPRIVKLAEKGDVSNNLSIPNKTLDFEMIDFTEVDDENLYPTFSTPLKKGLYEISNELVEENFELNRKSKFETVSRNSPDIFTPKENFDSPVKASSSKKNYTFENELVNSFCNPPSTVAKEVPTSYLNVEDMDPNPNSQPEINYADTNVISTKCNVVEIEVETSPKKINLTKSKNTLLEKSLETSMNRSKMPSTFDCCVIEDNACSGDKLPVVVPEECSESEQNASDSDAYKKTMDSIPKQTATCTTKRRKNARFTVTKRRRKSSVAKESFNSSEIESAKLSSNSSNIEDNACSEGNSGDKLPLVVTEKFSESEQNASDSDACKKTMDSILKQTATRTTKRRKKARFTVTKRRRKSIVAKESFNSSEIESAKLSINSSNIEDNACSEGNSGDKLPLVVTVESSESEQNVSDSDACKKTMDSIPKQTATHTRKRRKKTRFTAIKKRKSSVAKESFNSSEIEYIFKDLEKMKFTKQNFKENVDNLVGALINPEHSLDTVQLIFHLIQYLYSDFRGNASNSLSIVDDCIVSALFKIEENEEPEFQCMLNSTVTTLYNMVFGKEFEFPLKGLVSLCRLLTEICKRQNNKIKPIKLCGELIKWQHQYAPYLIASVANIWQEIFQPSSYSGVEERLFFRALARGVKNKPEKLSVSEWKQCQSILSKVFSVKATEGTQISKDVCTVFRKIGRRCLFTDAYDDDFLLTTPLVIFAQVKGWEWAEEALIKSFIVRSLKEYSTEKPNEIAFEYMINLYAEICFYCPDKEEPYGLLKFYSEADGGFVHFSASLALLKLVMWRGEYFSEEMLQWITKWSEHDKVTAILYLFQRRKMKDKNFSVDDIIEEQVAY